MTDFEIQIDGRTVQAHFGQSVLDAARSVGVDIPALCYLEKCGPLNSCLVCLVKVNGRLVPSCGTKVQPGMVIESETTEVHEARKTALELLFSDHVGDCLSPCDRLCPLGLNIPLMMRQVQAGQLGEAALNARRSLPLAGILGRLCHHPCEQGCRRGAWDEPAGIRDLERFVTDWERNKTAAGPRAILQFAPTGKTVVIIGSGPTGLSAAHYLARQGHSVTVVDRHQHAGGSLRDVPESELPSAVREAEIERLRELRIDFKLGVELGDHVRVDGLVRGSDAILIATGTCDAEETRKLGLPFSEAALKVDPNTCQTLVSKVFAAGAVVKPVKQLVRAMAEGRAAAQCIHLFLQGKIPRRPEKKFSSIMGRLDPGELKLFIGVSNSAARATPCERCAGYNHKEATSEAARCLHCDCASSGNCLLQHYAEVYGADASRFRLERKTFERQVQPGGIVFEAGKCILCGICVKLTELAREPLGLTFIGRGFDVRVAAPLNHTIEEGLQKVADECVKHCPTGALVKITLAK
ncbi:MAG: FAD-dependent oxidoreductase [Limisphaerales bacterium]